MTWIEIHLRNFSNETENLLKDCGLKNYWCELFKSKTIVFGQLPQKKLKEIKELLHSIVIKITIIKKPMVDWNHQWECLYQTQNNIIKVDLNLFSHSNLTTNIYLKAGPGFGTDKHDTTFLMLKLMTRHLHSPILDIGCGSGILSIAGAKWGVKKVYALDINPDALKHTKENALLNQVNVDILTYRKLKKLTDAPPQVCLMNMISSEQKEALKVILPFLKKETLFIVSGILKKEKKDYLAHSFFSHFKLLKTLNRGIWSGFVFQINQ